MSHRDSSLRLARELAAEETRELEKETVEKAKMQRSATMPVQPTTPNEGPLRYEDIMKGVIRAPPPAPASPAKDRKMSIGSKMSFGMGLGRKKSVKGRGDRYIG